MATKGITTDELVVEELEEALTVIIKAIQIQNFKDEIKQLRGNGSLNKKDPLANLCPFLDEQGVLRVGGRLQAANISYDAKHPALLPYSKDPSNLTRLLMTGIHNNNLHAGPQTLLAITHQRFWPIKGKTTARSIVQNCVRCARIGPKLLTHAMGNLPPHRVQPARPFVNSGVDFFGPFQVHYKIRGKRPHKCYVAVFCCFATKAVHLELVSDLTTEAFIAALKRFTGRRGNCRNLYCDNATNFIGAKNELAELKDILYSEKARNQIRKRCTERGIDFHFIPPRAPHFGGLWEAAVKSAKYLLLRSVNTASLTYEELETVVVEIEAILNSRPLTPINSDPNDFTALTPGHLLIGEPLTSTIDHQAEPSKSNISGRWRETVRIKNEFWQRWTLEYLNELQRRYKWKEHCKNAQPGMMVLIKEDNIPALKWPLGRIVQVISGRDGLVRVADVKTSRGVLRRPIHKLAPLPVEQEIGPSFNTEMPDTGLKRPSSTFDDTQALQSGPDGPSSEAAQKPHSPIRKRRKTNSVVTLAFLACLVLPVICTKGVEINPFKSPPGIYFESAGPTHLVFNEWNLVVFYNMKSYWDEVNTLKDGILQQNRICNKMRTNLACTATVNKISRLANELDNNNELLHHHDRIKRDLNTQHTRVKRSPLDIVGNIAGALFGVLDSKYAEKMSQIINDLENRDNYLLELTRNQTSLIDSTTNVMKEIYQAVDVQMLEFRNYINRTLSLTNNISEELHEQRLKEVFNALSIELILIATNYQRVQANLLNVIIDTHHGKVNPMLLSPKQLQAELIKIKEHLPSNLRLPTKQEELLELYNLLTIEGRNMGNQLIFRLRLPLFSYEQFELLRVIPVPIPMNETFLIIKPSSDFIIVNLHHDQYYPLSTQELSTCTIMKDSTYICKQHHPLYRQSSNISACEISIITSSTSKCKFTKTSDPPRWIQLLTPNHWIYVTPRQAHVNVICGNIINPITLKETGILKLHDGCTIKDETTIIHAHSTYSSTTKMSFQPSRVVTPVLNPLNWTEIYELAPAKEDTVHLIHELQRRITLMKDEESRTKFRHHDIHQYTIGYITFIVIIIILIYLLWKCYGHRFAQGQQPQPVPAPRRRLSQDFEVHV